MHQVCPSLHTSTVTLVSLFLIAFENLYASTRHLHHKFIYLHVTLMNAQVISSIRHITWSMPVSIQDKTLKIYRCIPLPANMQKAVKMTHVLPQQLPGLR